MRPKLRRFINLCCLTLCFCLCADDVDSLQLIQVDLHERLYPDRWPQAANSAAISVPRGAPVTAQFALRSPTAGTARIRVDGDLPGEARVHWLESVHVEGNTQGSLKNRPGGEVPEGWLEVLVREAPFDTLEVLVESDQLAMTAGRTHGIVIELSVPREVSPGNYQARLAVTIGDSERSVPFAFRVHRIALPDPLPMHATHWLHPQPHNLTSGEAPEWWSERHWELLASAGKQLRRFGDDTVYTPLVNHREPLIQIIRRQDGSYHFDYARFDRWANTFFGLGFRYLAGIHVIRLPSPYAGGTYVLNEASGKQELLFADPRDREALLAFLPIFYDSLYAHLKARGWLDNYLQCQYDEPKDLALYKRLAALARTHLPGVRTTDAINSRAQHAFSPLIDEHVFNLIGLNKFQEMARQRRVDGKGVWLYHCSSPYPPHPNRHIDCHLTESRLYPWLCYKLNANGFLFWAANNYRGAKEYRTSIGPFPNGSQDPGHPPGDNWFFYRAPDGLRPSIRIVAHREGMIDYALLTMLADHDPALVKQLIAQIAPSIIEFERQPAAYHQARAAILDALDNR